MAKFFFSFINGTTAIISETDALIYAAIKKAGGKPGISVSVFTFVGADSPMLEFATGKHEDMRRLIELGGHTVTPGNESTSPWDGYVPFSNGIHNAQEELEYRTTLTAVLETFLANNHPPYSENTLR